MAALVWRFSPRAGNGSRFMHGGPCRLAYRVNWMDGSKVTKSVWCPSSLPCSPAPEDDQRERLLQKREILQRLNEGSYCLTLHPIRNCCFCGMWTHYTLTYKHTLTCSFSPASLFLKMAAALRKATILATNFYNFCSFQGFWMAQVNWEKHWFSFFHAVTLGLPIFSFIFKDNSCGFF